MVGGDLSHVIYVKELLENLLRECLSDFKEENKKDFRPFWSFIQSLSDYKSFWGKKNTNIFGMEKKAK